MLLKKLPSSFNMTLRGQPLHLQPTESTSSPVNPHLPGWKATLYTRRLQKQNKILNQMLILMKELINSTTK